MTDDLWVQRRVNDLKIGFIFLTRLPLPHQQPIAKGDLSQALWTAPIVGAGLGLLGAGVYGLAQSLHLPPLPAAALAVAATVVVTGGLHEDGLADVADGFGGGATRERKLEIMHDSRIGTYGVCALILSFLLRDLGAGESRRSRRWWPPCWLPLTLRRVLRSPPSCGLFPPREPTA